MIKDCQTNFIYIADTLSKKYPSFYKRFVSILDKNKIDYGILPGTKDVWAVDYMPIQVTEKKFVRFTYKPDYLIEHKKWIKTITNVDAICERLGIETIKSEIILDGGNISKWNDKVLMTSKVFKENRQMNELDLIDQLKELLEVNEINFVPIENGDWLGHVDGMARFINGNTLLINEPNKSSYEDNVNLLISLHNSGLKWETFPFNLDNNNHEDDAAGLYLNYVEMEDVILLPIFGFGTDKNAIEKATSIFSDKKVIPVRSNEPAKDTGVLNCLTWNIKNVPEFRFNTSGDIKK